MTVTLLAAGPKYLRGTRVVPTTDSGWQTYLNGSRMFLPAATNYFTNPRLIENGGTNYPVTVINGSNGVGAIVPDVVANGDGTYYHEMVCTIAAGDLVFDKNYGVTFNVADFVAGGDPHTQAIEYQLIVSNARSCTVGRFVSFNQAYGDSCTAVLSATSQWARASTTIASHAAGTTGLIVFVLADVLDATAVVGDTITLRWRYMSVVKSTILTPYFDGSYPNCAWTGAADASTSTRTASDLVLTDYVEITSAGVVAAGTKVAYAHNPSAGYYGPVVITDNAKSGPWQTAFASATNLNTIWNSLVATDMLLPLASNGIGWVKR